MEIQRINSHTIHVDITKVDLEDRGMNLVELLGDQKRIEGFFFEILNEIEDADEFRETEQLTFQVLPNRNGVELFISNGVEDEEIFDEMFSEQEPTVESVGNDVNVKDPTEVDTDYLTDVLNYDDRRVEPRIENVIYRFKNFETLINLVNSLSYRYLDSDLYHYRGEFYLVVKYDNSMIDHKSRFYINAKMIEFGERVLPSKSPNNKVVDSAELENHGKLLMSYSAVENIRSHFKK